jgi:hypothetical protein
MMQWLIEWLTFGGTALPVKVIAIELGLSYTSVHKQLKKMCLIG